MHSLNSNKLPSSLGRVPLNELCDKSKNATQKKERDRKANNERRTDTASLCVLLDAEPQVRDTQSMNSLNSNKLPSSLGRVPLNELCDKSKNAAQKKERDRKAKNERHTGTANLFVLLDAERHKHESRG
jgi:hypothetical protein